MSLTDQLIAMLDAIDLRGKLPTRTGAAAYRRRDALEMAAVKWLVIHHTSGNVHARPTVQQVAAYQTGADGHEEFPAISYHLYVEADGLIEVCHDLETVTWGQGAGSSGTKFGIGLNNWWGIAVAFSGATPTGEQVQAMSAIADAVDAVLGRHLDARAHAELSPTECPGPGWETWLDEIASSPDGG